MFLTNALVSTSTYQALKAVILPGCSICFFSTFVVEFTDAAIRLLSNHSYRVDIDLNKHSICLQFAPPQSPKKLAHQQLSAL